MALSQRIAEAIRVRGMNPYALEITAGLSKGQAHRLIKPRGETQRPGVQTVRLVSAALDAPFAWIQDGAGEPPLPRPEPPPPQPRIDVAEMPALTLNDRAWVAFEALPRVRGRPPSRESLERKYELPRDILSDLFKNARSSVPPGVAAKIAEALGTTEAWLLEGVGEAPVVTGPIRPRTTRYPLNAPGGLLPLTPQLIGVSTGDFEAHRMLDLTKLLQVFDVAARKFAKRSSEDLLRLALPLARERCSARMSVEECELEIARAMGQVWRAQHEARRRAT